MSTIAAKKPPVTGRDLSGSSASSPPSRATPRSSTPNGTLVDRPSAANHARTRSFRTGTPVSARAAAGTRKDGSLPATSGVSVEEEEAVRAEKVAAIDDLKERLAKAETASEEYRKQAEVLQSRFDEVTKENVKNEEKCHELEEQTEALQNEKREATRKIRELEGIYEAEHSAMVKDKEEMSNREEELQMIIARLKDSLNQQKMSNNDDEPRSSRPGMLVPFARQGRHGPRVGITPRTNYHKFLQQVRPHLALRVAALPRPQLSPVATRGINPS